ncbi:hypothetical protein IGK47_003795 [Enterococcus sp. AZ007]
MFLMCLVKLTEPQVKNRSIYKNSDLILNGVFGISPSYAALVLVRRHNIK